MAFGLRRPENLARVWRSFQPETSLSLALRAELEGLVKRLCLAGVLAGDLSVLGVGSDEGLGLAVLGAVVHVENGEIDHLVDDRADDERLLAAVARRPDPAPLVGGWRQG